jgi:hypothetical protein
MVYNCDQSNKLLIKKYIQVSRYHDRKQSNTIFTYPYICSPTTYILTLMLVSQIALARLFDVISNNVCRTCDSDKSLYSIFINNDHKSLSVTIFSENTL